jgi:hypothetical protein
VPGDRHAGRSIQQFARIERPGSLAKVVRGVAVKKSRHRADDEPFHAIRDVHVSVQVLLIHLRDVERTKATFAVRDIQVFAAPAHRAHSASHDESPSGE